MILSLTCTAPDATDLGFLLHKNPNTVYERPLPFGSVRVFYTSADTDRCTAVLTVNMDSVGLVRGRHADTLAQYVSDRAYAPSSFLSTAISEAFGTAMGGRSKERQGRVLEKMPMSAHIPGLSCDAGAEFIRKMFAPLGYDVEIMQAGWLDERFPEWGKSNVFDVRLSGVVTVREILQHIYVLIPVLDNAKHYAFGEDEVEKLLAKGEDWLPAHPEKEQITRRYLRYRRTLADSALARLADVEGLPDADEVDTRSQTEGDNAESALERPVRLHDVRIQTVVDVLQSQIPAPRRVIDLGCGGGRHIQEIRKALPGLETLAGMDVSSVALKQAARRLHLDRLNESERERIPLFVGSLLYKDERLRGFDTAILSEVIEHMEEDRLPTLVRVVWEHARPRRVVVTTPNADYNALFPSLPAGKFRHADHRFEWTRARFAAWANGICAAHGYTVAFSGIGDTDEERGAPTQMAIFDREGI